MREKTDPAEKWDIQGEDEPFTPNTGVCLRSVLCFFSLYLTGFLRVKPSLVEGR